jgi:PAS domain S-box-containing protein
MRTTCEIRILFVDDESAVLNSLRRFLRKEEYQQYFASSGREALAFLETQAIDIIVTDLRMPAMTGLELIAEVKHLYPSMLRLVLSASRDIGETIASINSGEVFRFIEKPLDPVAFKKILLDAVEHYIMKTEREALLDELETSNQELQQMNASLRKSADLISAKDEELSVIMEMASDAIIVTDDMTRIVFWNKAAEKLFGYTFDEVKDKILHTFLLSERFKKPYMAWREKVLHDFQQGEEESIVTVRRSVSLHKDGHQITGEMSATVTLIHDRPHFVTITRDLSQLEQLEKSRRILFKMQQAIERKIEKALLQAPPPTDLEGMEIAALTIPSGHLDGDFSDFIIHGRNFLDVVIGDVMGKGLSAALVASGLKSRLLKILAQHDCSLKPRITCPHSYAKLEQLGEIISDLHTMAVKELLELEMFSTLCYARFHLPRKKMAYVGCGHLPIIHYRAAENHCSYLTGDNLPIGLAEESEYRSHSIDYAEGDLFVFSSDGVTEAEDQGEVQFGLERFADVIRENHQQGPEQLLSTITDAVRNFTDDRRFRDDFTCIVVKINR